MDFPKELGLQLDLDFMSFNQRQDKLSLLIFMAYLAQVYDLDSISLKMALANSRKKRNTLLGSWSEPIRG